MRPEGALGRVEVHRPVALGGIVDRPASRNPWHTEPAAKLQVRRDHHRLNVDITGALPHRPGRLKKRHLRPDRHFFSGSLAAFSP